jgi:hypothetical protein
MNIEDIINAWKRDEESLATGFPESPVGREIDEQELLGVMGGVCVATCTNGTIHCKSTKCAGTCAGTNGCVADSDTITCNTTGCVATVCNQGTTSIS